MPASELCVGSWLVKSSLFSRKKWMLWLVRARRARNMELAATWVQMLDGGW